MERILKRGFVKGRTYLITDEAGTGKTIFSLQFLLEGIRNGKKCLFIFPVDPLEEVEKNIKSFGWSLNGIDLVYLTPQEIKDLGEYKIFLPSEVEAEEIWSSLFKTIEEKSPERLVIDGASFLLLLSTDEYQFRKKNF